MKKPYVINLLVSAVLFVTGLYGYLAAEGRPLQALVAPGLGVLLALCTPAMKKENKTIAHLVVVLTLLFGLVSMNMAIRSGAEADRAVKERKMAVFSVMAVACFAATGFYIMGFIEKKKAGRASQE